jgi:hypothetical protein
MVVSWASRTSGWATGKRPVPEIQTVAPGFEMNDGVAGTERQDGAAMSPLDSMPAEIRPRLR